jgi:hypothetical protein
MGNKRITEKDFWICSLGNVPAQLQSTQKSTHKISGEKYITVKDTSTSSWIDFGCKKIMLIYAIIAAAVVVIAAMTVATGGAALIALGALAGLAGAAWGAVLGALLCGQTAAKGRKWVEAPTSNVTAVQGVNQVTGDCTMTCMVGGTITFAPQIKSWSQAISLGAANYIGGLMEGMMAGAAIGMGGAALSGGASAFASGGIRGVGQAALQFAKSAPLNVIKNIGATFGYSGGFSLTSVGTAVGLRGVTAAQSGLQQYGSTGESGWGAAGEGVFGMETGMAHSVNNLTTFHDPKTGKFGWQGSWQDVTGLALLLSPVHKATEEPKTKGEEPVQEGDNNQGDKESVKDVQAKADDAPKQEGEHETYSDPANQLDLITVDKPFKPGEGHDVVEFERQIKGQQEGMNKLTVDDFITNRDAYLKKLADEKAAGKKNPSGRSKESAKAQERFRERIREDKIDEFRKQKYTREEAERMADEYLSDKAALHDPDQVAGGFDDKLTGMGNTNINSSIGRQWQDRIGKIDSEVRKAAGNMTEAERKSTYLNVHLYP